MPSPEPDTTQGAIDRAAAVIKCLGHPLRLRLLDALGPNELTVSELQDRTGAKQASVSRQLGILRSRNIVSCRREGLNVYYWTIEPRVRVILNCLDGDLDNADDEAA